MNDLMNIFNQQRQGREEKDNVAMVINFQVEPSEAMREDVLERMRNAAGSIIACAEIVDELIVEPLEVHCGEGFLKDKRVVVVGTVRDIAIFADKYFQHPDQTKRVKLVDVQLVEPTYQVLRSDRPLCFNIEPARHNPVRTVTRATAELVKYGVI